MGAALVSIFFKKGVYPDTSTPTGTLHLFLGSGKPAGKAELPRLQRYRTGRLIHPDKWPALPRDLFYGRAPDFPGSIAIVQRWVCMARRMSRMDRPEDMRFNASYLPIL